MTDYEYTILSLLRSHKFDETSKIQIREKYPFTSAANQTIENITTDIRLILTKQRNSSTETSRIKKYKLKKRQNRVKIKGRRRYSLVSNSLKKDKNAKKHEKKSKESNNLKTVLTKMVP